MSAPGEPDHQVRVAVAVDVADRQRGAEVAAAQPGERWAQLARPVGTDAEEVHRAGVGDREIVARRRDGEVRPAIAVEIARGHHRAELRRVGLPQDDPGRLVRQPRWCCP